MAQKYTLEDAAEKLRSMGRQDDVILAHINPREAKLLKAAGGSGKPNPKTGLPEFLEQNGDKGNTSGGSGGVADGGYSSGNRDGGFGAGSDLSGVSPSFGGDQGLSLGGFGGSTVTGDAFNDRESSGDTIGMFGPDVWGSVLSKAPDALTGKNAIATMNAISDFNNIGNSIGETLANTIAGAFGVKETLSIDPVTGALKSMWGADPIAVAASTIGGIAGIAAGAINTAAGNPAMIGIDGPLNQLDAKTMAGIRQEKSMFDKFTNPSEALGDLVHTAGKGANTGNNSETRDGDGGDAPSKKSDDKIAAAAPTPAQEIGAQLANTNPFIALIQEALSQGRIPDFNAATDAFSKTKGK